MPVALLPLLILLGLRLLFLDARPVHHDEAVNGWFIDGIFRRGFFVYDPQNYHGPLFFYWTALSEKIFGRGVIGLRIPAVIFGSLLSLSPFLYRRWIGERAAWIASLLLVVSPAAVFFSRYAIHESAFAFFSAATLALWLAIRESGWSGRRAWGLGLLVGVLAGIKENFVLFVGAVFFAEYGMRLLKGRVSVELREIPWSHLFLTAMVALAVIFLSFTGAFQDTAGFGKFFEAFQLWARTGSKGNGHEKPFYYWIQVLGRLEWPAVLGLVGFPLFGWKFPEPIRKIGWVGLFLFVIYSAVPYKTPWCLLSFYWAPVIFAGVLLSSCLSWRAEDVRGKILTGFAAAGILVSMVQAGNVAYLDPDQDDHPYVYGQTYADLLVPLERMFREIRERPDGLAQFRVQVVSAYNWPLPYLLGELQQVGYYNLSNLPEALDADQVIVDESLLDRVSHRLSGSYSRECVRARQWASPMCFLRRQPAPPAG